ncbi:hypothetical protein PENSTE_c011G08845 [Penicillium steckii]|uniref:DUF6604 domain-containing protein n=1 Tax=Penicillium steckii TaxID=303698 RepID=A0A1V6T638_9EURO|nr:hypothetical protein PENSTE_c011G08845 [Penicillium steckii]
MSNDLHYRKYKQYETYIIQWISEEVKIILKKHPEEAEYCQFVTGPLSLSRLKQYAKLIARHAQSIPATIIHPLQDAIEGRKRTREFFLEQETQDITKTESHNTWLEGLEEILRIFEGVSSVINSRPANKLLG